MNTNVFVTFVDLSNITRDTYPILFAQMKEDKIETWFLPPGYRIYQDGNDHHDYYRFSSHKHYSVGNSSPHNGSLLFSAIAKAHKHYQEKNLIEMLNKNARIE